MIWALFSVRNDYDQPDNNLEAWWSEKPKLEVLAKALGKKFPSDDDDEVVGIVGIWAGTKNFLPGDNTHWRLVCLSDEGIVGPRPQLTLTKGKKS